MQRVVLESPYSGDIEKNIEYAKECMQDCFARGEAPFASHLLYTQSGVLNDALSEDRRLGIEAGLTWGKAAEKTVVYEDLGISEGMRIGIERAVAEGRSVEYRRIKISGKQK